MAALTSSDLPVKPPVSWIRSSSLIIWSGNDKLTMVIQNSLSGFPLLTW